MPKKVILNSKYFKYYIFLFVAFAINSFHSYSKHYSYDTLITIDTIEYEPSFFSSFQLKDRYSDPYSNLFSNNPYDINTSILELSSLYDTAQVFFVTEKIGKLNYRPSIGIPFDLFDKYNTDNEIKNYFKEKSVGLDGENTLESGRLIPKIFIPQSLDRIFGGNYIDLQVNGFVNLDFGGRFQRIENPSIPIRQQKNGGFNYDQQINLNIDGKVGEKLKITANFDNNNTFDFQNNLKLDYTGYDEEIIKKIEVGNVSMPVSNSLLRGAQSLFGLKTQLQFGRLSLTGILSRQQGKSESIKVENGFQGREFEIIGSEYDENRHFFLGHYFRNNYEKWLKSLPLVTSGININRVEVYILNRTNNSEALRNFIALTDLAEGKNILANNNPFIGPGILGPNDNSSNNLFKNLNDDTSIRNPDLVNDKLINQYGLLKTIDFEKVTSARKLNIDEFKINKSLGYISLLRRLQNDEVLAVSYEYTFNGNRYKVGELMEDYQNKSDDEIIILKLLRPSNINTEIFTWDLMMKNVYNLNATQIESQNFDLKIYYRDDAIGFNNPSLNEGVLTRDKPLIRLLGLDRLNSNNDPQYDGNFDFVEGFTIDSKKGNIIFPVLEPFGSTLESFFIESNENNLSEKYVFKDLYSKTKSDAKEVLSKNKFFIIGSVSSGSGSEINLPGLDISENSVVVMSGNIQLKEGSDYTVNYNLGSVRIINPAILSSGQEITISFEKADLFNFQTKWLSGARAEYTFDESTNLGFTVFHLNERPGGITRFSVGNEPIKNTKYGFDFNINKESELITKIINTIPLLGTREKSNITFSSEFAQIVPGTSNIINGEGTTYIDDFENSITPLSLGSTPNSWKLGSTPETDNDKFDLSNSTVGKLGYAFKRAKISWYRIDNIFYLNGGVSKPSNITLEDLQNNYVKSISPQDIFRQQDRQLINTNLPIFDIAYFPNERGQYNYNTDLLQSGFLKDPKSNFGAITKSISNDTDFDKTNIQYLEFWMMDPFIDGENGKVLDGVFNKNNTTGGNLIFNLGNVSEDIMKDNIHAFENGLSSDYSNDGINQNEWGRVTSKQYLTKFFENSSNSRINQDIGLDGLKNDDEKEYFKNSFIDNINVTSDAQSNIDLDVSADNFKYYLGDDLDESNKKIIERYKNYNGMEGNTPISSNTNYAAQGSPFPENEDLNEDNTLSDLESYYEYEINLKPNQLDVGKNNIVDKVVDKSGSATWYQFRIPIRDPDRIQGSISDFKTIRFLRTYLTGFEEPVILRLAKFQLVGSQWRKYKESLFESGLNEIPESSESDFDISVVNVEDNSIGSETKSPYVVPPGIKRDVDNTTIIQRRNNEQSLQLCVNDLSDGDARAVFKESNFDLINYGRIKMFIHAEANNGSILSNDEIHAFLRFGSDYKNNFYEIELPLKVTNPNLVVNSNNNIARVIWPEENEINLDIEELLSLKSERNRLNVDISTPFSKSSKDGKYILKIVGRPSVSSVLNFMLGIKNPLSIDRGDKSACLWFNELRLTDFDKTKGWAANANLNLKLSDFATISSSARYTSVGFGSLQQRISERTREERLQYDASANINLDKFLPSKSGIKLPLYLSLSKSKITPKYDPLDKDIPLDASINSFDTKKERREYRNITEENIESRSISLNNVRKERTKKDSRSDFWDLENLSTSFSYNERKSSNVTTQAIESKNHSANLTYNFSPKKISIEPFKNIEWLNSKIFSLIQDINFSPLPSNISIKGDMNRRFNKTQYRNSNLTIENVDPIFEKYFSFNRSYNLRWNIFKSMSIDINAINNSVIDEPEGDLDSKEKRDSVFYNIRNMGRTKNYNQNININYKLPIDKFPLTNWISSNAKYSVRYLWTAGSFQQADTLGNNVENSRDYSLNTKLDISKFYDKLPFLKKYNKAYKSKDSINSLLESKVFDGLMKFIMSLRSLNFTYNVNERTGMAGIINDPNLFGFNVDTKSPGWNFILGSQDSNIRNISADNNWLVKNDYLNTPFVQSRNNNFQFRGSLQPLNSLRIQLDAKRIISENYQETFRYNSSENSYVSLTPTRGGNFSLSFLSIKTAFIKDNEFNSSSVFENFVENRKIIRDRLGAVNSSGEYGLNSQDVLIPAFISAYSAQNASNFSLNPFPKIPIPNWRIDFSGLNKIKAISEIFSSITISHSYQSMYSIGNFTNSLFYTNDLDFNNSIMNYPLASEMSENGLIPFYIINQVRITERFAPLIGINIRTKNNLNARVDYKRDRNIMLNLSNSQISELQNADFSIDFGYTKEKLKLPFRYRGNIIILDNDIQFKLNFVIRNTKTVQRKIDGENVVTNGNYNFQLRPNINYVVNNRISLIMYYDKIINKPLISNSFPRYSSSFGVRLRMGLTQ
tara:strand:+ start:18456 stop:25547 length:7092 start_codon:yes stop_codon:yes gene_type:complete